MPSLRRIASVNDAPPGRAARLGERGLASVGYALSVAALFTFWVTGAAAFLLAWTHRRSPDPLARAHFRFQLWVADIAGVSVGLAVGVLVCALSAAGGPLLQGDWPTPARLGGAVGLFVVGVGLWAMSFALTIVAAGWGFMRLTQGLGPLERRPQTLTSRTAEPIRNPGPPARP